MHTTLDKPKVSRRLLSPLFSIEEVSCLSFKFTISGLSANDIKVASVILIDDQVTHQITSKIIQVM